MEIDAIKWVGDDEKAVAILADGSKAAVRFAGQVITLDEVVDRLHHREKGDDLPILMGAFGCDYDAACDAVFNEHFDLAESMLQEAVAPKPDVGPNAKEPRNDSVVLIPHGQMAFFQKRLDALNKKAANFGLDPIKVISTEDVVYQRKVESLDRDNERQLYYLVPAPKGELIADPVLLTRIEIEYPEVKLGNWQVVGKLEAVEGGNLAFSISRQPADEAALAARADCPIECEHCQTKRKRNDGYLLRDNESGEYKQVGSNCLEDFTGIDPAAALFLARMSQVVSFSEGELNDFASSGRVNAVDTLSYLADVNFITDNYGFVSAGKARDTGVLATYDEAIGLSRELTGSKKDAYFDRRERDLAKAAAVRDWIANKPEESLFDRNVKLLLQSDALPLDRKALAFAAATIVMHNRSLAATVEASKPSEHIGEPGQKMKANLTVDRVVPIETRFGYADLVLMHDTEGNKVKWKTSACPSEIRDVGVGHTMEAAFKIKDHDEYNGKAQTSITHLKITRWLDLENDADDLAAHEPETTYRVSVFLHPAGEARDYARPVYDSIIADGNDLVELVAEAKIRTINQLHTEGENMWFASGPDDDGNTLSLHLHEVDGREPTDEDFKHLAEMLGVPPERRAEVEPTP